MIKANADSAAVDTTALAAATAAVADLDEAEYQADGWAVFSSLLGDAEAATADPVTYGLDAEGAAAIVKRLNTAAASLIPTDVSEDSVSLGLIAVVAADGLPTSLSLGGDPVAVVWDGDAATQFAAASSLGTVALTGRSSAKLAETGLYQRFSATVLVVPDDLVYFIDSGSSNSAAGSVFAAVSAAFPGLANNAADQKWDGTTAGSTWGYATTATAITAGTAADWASSFLGADYSKPITYSLTLPAGSYDIVTIQPARSGATTNIYSTVTAGSYTNRITAVSSGAATPITQRVTVSQETVVKVEYGTNGTSGYNARLALVYVQAVPRDLGVQAALTVGSPLPGTVTIDGVETAVTWDEASLAKTLSAYQLVSVAGTVSVAGVEQQITAKYEIIPDGLVYYVDSGTNGVDSPQYLAVKAAVPGLLNQTADQASTSADQWGYVATTLKLKGSTDINDKYSTGWYEDSTNLVYRLSLEPGTYTLTGGFTEWWNITRTMNHSVSANGVELAKGNIALSGSNTPLAEQLTFTLTEAATVQYLVTNEGAGGEKPVISWLAVAQEEEPEPEFVLPAKIVAKLATGVTYQVGDSFALGADALTVTGTDAAGAAVEIDQAGLSSNAPATFTKAGNYVVKVTYTVEGQSVSTSIVVRVVAKTLTLN